MKKQLLGRYLLVDMKRAFTSWRFAAGIMGVFMVLEVAAFESRQWQICVLNSFNLVIYSMPFLLTLIFTTLVFGQCFCEDIEHHYIRLMVIRGNLKTYTVSKAITIMVSSIVTMTAAILLFAAVLHMKYPWISLEESTYETLVQQGSFHCLLKNGNYVLYFTLCGIQYGIFSGVMSLLAALFSLIYHDTLFVPSTPVMAWYGIQYLESSLFPNSAFGLHNIFSISSRAADSDLLSFGYVLLTGIILSVLITAGIYKGLKKQTA